jgi:katanin p60 ATPase-containing subunit A1
MIDLPTTAARKKMIQYHLDKHEHNLKDEDFERIAKLTENYSGADIKLLCKEAAMRPVRVILKKLEEANNLNISNQRNLLSPEINIEKLMQLNPITSNHVECSLDCTRVSANIAIFERYRCWEKLHGSSI